MLIYVVLMLLSLSGYLVGANRSEKSRKYYLTIVFAAILLVAMLRSDQIGTDLRLFYSKYFPRFQDADWSRLQSVTVSGDWEWGFCAFCKMIGMISTDVQCFIVFSSLVTIVPYVLFIYRNSDDVVFSTVFFLGYHVYMMSLNVVRQAMAVGIVLLGLEALKRKRYIRFLIYVGMAALFHTSAIFAAVLILCDWLKFHKNTFYLLAAATMASGLAYRFLFQFLISGDSALSSLYGIYYSSAGAVHSGGFVTFHTLGMFVIAAVIFVLGCLYYNNEKIWPRPYRYGKKWRNRCYIKSLKVYRYRINKDEMAYWSENMLMYAVYFAVLFRFAAFIVNVTARLSMYFFPFLMITFPHVCSKIQDVKLRRNIQLVMVLMVLAFFFFIGFTRAEGLWGTVPYKPFWRDM